MLPAQPARQPHPSRRPRRRLSRPYPLLPWFGSPLSPPSGAPTTGGSLAIQVASFRTRERAEVVLKEVTERTGLPGVIESSEVNGEEWQRILLGSFTSPEEAETAAEPLIRARIIRSVVVRSIPEAFRSVLSRP